MSLWTCNYCGAERHNEMQLTDELHVDVTCQSVYVLTDDGWGVAMDHDEFEELIRHYRRSRPSRLSRKGRTHKR